MHEASWCFTWLCDQCFNIKNCPSDRNRNEWAEENFNLYKYKEGVKDEDYWAEKMEIFWARLAKDRAWRMRNKIS